MAISFKEWLEAWTQELLGEYTNRLETQEGTPRRKEFNDPIWGTILLHPAEVLIVDSPLVQRLRRVSQLGVVHLVYSAANHTRFDHTLGVVHQMGRLIRSINDHCDDDGDHPPIRKSEEALLRLTALCHDIGHGARSHVSENALDGVEAVESIILDFADEIGDERIPLAEIAAYHMVGSDAFRRLIDVVRTRVDNHHLPSGDETVDKMRNAIIGRRISNRVPLMHELVSGPFDADKLDYMTRDARMTGIPEVTDISRLVQKVRAIGVAPDKLPTEIAKQVDSGESHYVVTGIAFSGGRTVDELILGRTLQQDKLFRHHKVRATEAMVASLYRQIAACAPEMAPVLPYLLEDEDFVRLTRERVATIIGRPLGDDDSDQVTVALDIADRLKRRDLFGRAYAFALGMPLDPYRADSEHYAGLERLMRESGDFPQRGQIIDAIVGELERALELLEIPLREAYPDLKPYVWLDPLYVTSESNDSARAYLIADQGERPVLRFQDEYAETVRWASAYIQTRDVGYVFCPKDLSPYVYVAAEKVFRRDFDIRTPETLLMYTKQRFDQVSEIKSKLHDKHYYDGIAYDVRPAPSRLTRGDIPQRITKLCERLSGYEGPVRGGAIDKKRTLLSGERVLAWLRQFPPDLADEPLKILEEIHLVSRSDVVSALDAFIDMNGENFGSAALCPLGEPKDSSAVTTYWASGESKGGLTVCLVRDALIAPNDSPIVFVEDFIGSGQQSVSILEAWLDEEPTTDLGERREPLDPHAAGRLRERELAFVFAAGTDEGAGLLRKRCDDLGLTATVSVAHNSLPRAFEGALTTKRAALKVHCARAGSELLLDPDNGHDEEWVEKRMLGYGNDAYLVLFGYNTPTQALTCLWKNGTVEEIPWMALFPRRPKR
jgi:deoxynucleoside triphosphate triphosphohydrolase SAMHD1